MVLMLFGTTKTTTTMDDKGSTRTIIDKVRMGETVKTYRQYCVRIKVKDSKEEMTQYLKYTEVIRDLRAKNLLVLKDEDVSLMPNFRVEYPKTNTDGSYFISKSWTEAVEL